MYFKPPTRSKNITLSPHKPSQILSFTTTPESGNNITSSPKPFFGDYIGAVGDVYRPLHGYVTLVVCSSAMVVNAFVVVVLQR